MQYNPKRLATPERIYPGCNPPLAPESYRRRAARATGAHPSGMPRTSPIVRSMKQATPLESREVVSLNKVRPMTTPYVKSA
ncbi:hypothetical protein RSOL_265870 [Rhizoctonia solani AG-3 Rhs1AP]|uniref:Uncharacterized protein n=1 Tax=Rhizoctonia solani AG-3 Rhs1AP TaxID=1086054 RepID=A0A0A1UI42_9AGAM|nr:hypothetical protein RSOL_265870 [Rhizoctonia solani AG-3 Rhs1AP]